MSRTLACAAAIAVLAFLVLSLAGLLDDPSPAPACLCAECEGDAPAVPNTATELTSL